MRQYTVEWQLYVQWRYGSTSWKALKDLKEFHPVETAEYAVAHEIDPDMEFNWWVNAALKKILRIISLHQEEERSLHQEDSQLWD